MGENFKVNHDLAWREVDGQILILDTRETESAHELNPMASHIFEQISRGQSYSDIEEDLLKTYGEDNSHLIKEDLRSFINDLLEKKIIQTQ